MDEMPTDENVFQLAILDILFQIISIFTGFLTDVLLPGLFSGVFGSLFGGGTVV